MFKMIEGQKLINFYAALADQEAEADEIKKDISEQLKSQASNIEISPKAMKAGYNLYKKYRNGKSTQNEIDDYTEVENIITTFFVTSQDE